MDENHTLPEDENDELTPEEINLLNTLRATGPALPAELAVKTFSLPEEVDEAIDKLKAKNLVDTRQVPGAYGELVTLSKFAISVQTRRSIRRR